MFDLYMGDITDDTNKKIFSTTTGTGNFTATTLTVVTFLALCKLGPSPVSKIPWG